MEFATGDRESMCKAMRIINTEKKSLLYEKKKKNSVPRDFRWIYSISDHLRFISTTLNVINERFGSRRVAFVEIISVILLTNDIR